MDKEYLQNIDFGENYAKYGIIGRSEKISETISICKTVAPADISVLITGESGTGKEVFANLIHKFSSRKDKSFLAINCGAIPEGLIENELFGHEKGSFTSASDKRKGYFESASGGTLFLDEIGELPLQSQVKLLRVLETGTITRVGGVDPIKVDVRIVAATNKDLASMVQKKSFREDLYYRLKAINLVLPSLNSRLDDIPLFAIFFARQCAEKNNTPLINFSREAFGELINHHWKGNIRELKNFIEMLSIMEAGKLLEGSTVRKYILDKEPELKSSLPVLISHEYPENDNEIIFKTLLEIKNDLNLIKTFLFEQAKNQSVSPAYSMLGKEYNLNPSDEIMTHNFFGGTEKEEIEFVLKKNRGNRRKAAKELGISERTLYRKIEKYDIKDKF